MIFKRLPLLPYLISFALGVLIAQLFSIEWRVWILSLALLGAAWVGWIVGRKRVVVLLLLCATFFLGIQRFQIVEQGVVSPGEPWPGIPDGTQTYECLVSSYPQKKEYGWAFRCELTRWKRGREWSPVVATARLSLIDAKAPKQGDHIRFKSRLRSPRNFGNDREFDSERYARSRGIDLAGTIGSYLRWVTMEPATGRFRTFLNRVRAQAIDRAEIFLQSDHLAIFKSLVLGERMVSSSPVREAFRSAGVLHLLVVSGFHVSMMALVFAFLSSFLLRTRARWVSRFSVWRVKAWGGALGAIFFCLLTDLPIPTLRALIAVLLVLLAVLFERPKDGLAVWVFAALGILIYQPLFLFDLSAQLSFSALLGILLALERFPPSKYSSTFSRWLIGSITVSFGATLATLPILLFYFSRMTLWSILGNLLFVPTIGVIGIPLGFSSAFLGGPFAPLGNFLFSCLDQFLDYVLPIVQLFNNLPGSDLWVARPHWFSLVAYAGFLLMLRREKPWRTFAIYLAFFSLVPSATALIWPHTTASRIHFLHVGEGDAMLVASKEGRSILIDTGSGGSHSFDAGERIILPWLRLHGKRGLDILAITHGDLDHIGGARSILEEIEVGELWLPREKNVFVQELCDEAERRHIPWRSVDSETEPIVWGDMTLTVLHPPASKDLPYRKSNNRSLVLRVEENGFRALLTGDIEASAEHDLVRRGVDLRADLLKVPHHGSRTSTTSAFLSRIHPKDAVITSGWKNRFGHPADSVVKRLEGHGVRIWRGDLCGELMVQLDEEKISYQPVSPCQNQLE